jgi:hypothetical protein
MLDGLVDASKKCERGERDAEDDPSPVACTIAGSLPVSAVILKPRSG